MKYKIKISLLFVLALFAFQFSLPTIQVFALKDEAFYSANNIIYYDPDAVDCNAGQTQASNTSTSIKVEKNATIDTIYKFLTTETLSTNDGKALNAAQASGIMGNMYAESGFNPSAVEATTRADKGHGLVQWTFGRWNNLEAFAKEKGKSWDNVDVQLEFLKKELEGAEKAVIQDKKFSTTSEPAVAAMQFRIIFERADATVAHDDKREGAAISVYNQYSGSTATSECKSGSGIIAGNLVKTAIGLALPKPATEGMNNETLDDNKNKIISSRDTYNVAKPKYNPSVHWTDCGGFIAVVMYATEVDLGYPKVSVSAQLSYVRGNTDKYLVDENPTLNDLQPGDILFIDGHTTMYTGEDKYPSVDASWWANTPGTGRVPSVRDAGSATYMIQNGAVSARVIK